MKSDDKRFLKQVLDKVVEYKRSHSCASKNNPIDDEVITQFQTILGKISDDAFDIFRFKKNLMKLWKEMWKNQLFVCDSLIRGSLFNSMRIKFHMRMG